MKAKLPLLILVILINIKVSAQNFPSVFDYEYREKEINCFKSFDFNATGRNDVNAYLLAYLNHFIYVKGLRNNLIVNGVSLPPNFSGTYTFHSDYFPSLFQLRTIDFFGNNNSCRMNPPIGKPKEPAYMCYSGKIIKTDDYQNVRMDEIQKLLGTENDLSRSQIIKDFKRNPSKDNFNKLIDVLNDPRIQIAPKSSPAKDIVAKSIKSSATKLNAVTGNQLSDLKASIKVMQENRLCDSVNKLWVDFKFREETYLRALKKFQECKVKNAAAKFKWFEESDGSGVDPECMVISKPEYIIILFRGTDRVDGGEDGLIYDEREWGEWIGTDLDFEKVSVSYIDGEIHKGFKRSIDFRDFKGKIRKYLLDSCDVKNKKVWVTGHSLGGAQAQLFSAYLKDSDIDVQGVYVYGSPRVGDNTFKNSMQRLFPDGKLQRFEFMDDPVCGLPLRDAFGYRSAGFRNHFTNVCDMRFNTSEVTNDNLVLDGLKTIGHVLTSKFRTSSDFCFHHPEWYVIATHNQMRKNKPDFIGKLPNKISRPDSGWEACGTSECNKANNCN